MSNEFDSLVKFIPFWFTKCSTVPSFPPHSQFKTSPQPHFRFSATSQYVSWLSNLTNSFNRSMHLCFYIIYFPFLIVYLVALFYGESQKVITSSVYWYSKWYQVYPFSIRTSLIGSPLLQSHIDLTSSLGLAAIPVPFHYFIKRNLGDGFWCEMSEMTACECTLIWSNPICVSSSSFPIWVCVCGFKLVQKCVFLDESADTVL